ncbi:MAG: hypothetical protein WBF17_25520, partial [Phycisphaerae bacterium]
MKDLSLKATCLTLFLTTLLAMINVRAEQKMDNSPEKQELADAQRKKEKKQKENTGRRTEREFMKQLATGEPTAAQFAEYLKGNASRIGATIDHPSSLGVAVIRKLKDMPPEKLTKEVLPALEKQLMQ